MPPGELQVVAVVANDHTRFQVPWEPAALSGCWACYEHDRESERCVR